MTNRPSLFVVLPRHHPRLRSVTMIQMIDLQGNLLYEGELVTEAAVAEGSEVSGTVYPGHYGKFTSYRGCTQIDWAGRNNGVYVVMIRLGGQVMHTKVHLRTQGAAY